MAMLLRTRNKISLSLRVFCVIFVTLVYTFVGIVSRQDTSVKYEVSETLPGRHLLAIKTNDTIIDYDQDNDTVTISKVIKNCTSPAVDEFPSDGFTRRQRQNGAVVVHALLCCYLFILLATVCDEYFIPAVKKFCNNLKMREDIAGATIMAVASSSPELFINCVGTFVTEGDLGIGTIVGSAVFNVLAVPACCGLFANMVMEVDWWPVTRDSIMYAISVICLIVVLEDGKILLVEAAALVLVYSLYILLMCFNERLSRFAHKCVAKIRSRNYYVEVMGETHPLLFRQNGKYQGIEEILQEDITLEDCEKFDESTKIWEWPETEPIKGKIWWVLIWPISLLLYLTIPDCRKYPRLYVFTFIMCICWIGSTSYLVSWLITTIGDTLNIADSVMGLTFLAAGTSVPEAVSSVIVTKQGYATMGISSSIGSNTFDILLCLGIPWLVKAAFYPKIPGQHWVDIQSDGINISACALLSTLIVFYFSIVLNKFKLDWKIGLTCLSVYLMFLLLATLVELNVFFIVNLPTCDH